MPPTIIFIRHGQALNNVVPKAYHLSDPPLSEDGIKQCERLGNHLKEHVPLADRVELIITSPMRRALETTSIALSWLIKRGVPVVARAEWQENSAKPCDVGSPTSTLEDEFPFDYTSIEPPYPAKSGPYAYTQAAVLERGITARRWLRSRSEAVIAVVSHSAFLRTAVTNARFANGDYRIYDFSHDNNTVDIVQWDITESRGGGMGSSQKGWMTINAGDFRTEEEERLRTAVSAAAHNSQNGVPIVTSESS